MELRPAERLILLMLSEIYDHLGIDGETDTKLLRGAIFGGHGWALDWDMPGVTQVEETDRAIVSEVVDFLDMYDMIELSLADLSAADCAALPDWKLRFRGFDGNNETTYMSVARFMVAEMGRFSAFKGRDFNSHAPVVDRARAMYRVYEPLRPGTAHRNPPRLTLDDLKAIAAAA